MSPELLSTIDQFCQILILFTGCLSLYLVGSNSASIRMYAGLVGLFGEPFWFLTSYVHEQWPIVFLAGIYAASWARVFNNNYKEHRKLNRWKAKIAALSTQED